jgi:photosystem II stability/assembly factor-like uncharacterized protein
MGVSVTILVATESKVLVVDSETASVREGRGLDGHAPTFVAADPLTAGRAWCATRRGGVLRSDDAGESWTASGLAGEYVMTVVASPATRDLLWAGTEPSALWRSDDGGAGWRRAPGLSDLPSSREWSFPPKPETHHVRWIACHPADAGRLWLAIEAGALVTTPDGGRTWRDRVPGGPYDTHELAIHPDRPAGLRVAAGDGYYESADAGASWSSSAQGLDVGYLRSVAIDPGDAEVVVVSASSHAHKAYMAGRSDGRLYRRAGAGTWERVLDGWPREPSTIAPLLVAGSGPGRLWAADERGVHSSADGGRSWERVAAFEPTPTYLRGLAPLGR